MKVYRNNAGRLGAGFISVCLETRWLGQKRGFYVPERPCGRLPTLAGLFWKTDFQKQESFAKERKKCSLLKEQRCDGKRARVRLRENLETVVVVVVLLQSMIEVG